MTTNFQITDIIEMAIRIEKNGSEFYMNAAAVSENQEHKNFFKALAVMENNHQSFFENLKSQWTNHRSLNPESFIAEFLGAIADGHVFDMKEPPTMVLNASTPFEDLVRFALEREKDSIVFYTGLKGMVTSQQEREKIEEIINEELSHISQLSRFL